MHKTVIQFLKYLSGAAGGLLLDWLVWLAMMAAQESAILAQCAAKGSGALLAFALYRGWVFGGRAAPPLGQWIRFSQAVAAGWVGSILLVACLSEILPPWQAKILSDGVTFVLNYFLMGLWVFRTIPSGSEPGVED